jgi:hypothetical protein
MNGGENGDPGCLGYGYKCMQWYDGGNDNGRGDHHGCHQQGPQGCTDDTSCTGDVPTCPMYSVDPYQNIQNLLWNPNLGAPGDVVAGFAYGGGRKARNPNAMLGDLLSM